MKIIYLKRWNCIEFPKYISDILDFVKFDMSYTQYIVFVGVYKD